MTLDEALTELRSDVDAFEKWWREEHAKNPEHFPLEFPENDAGQWTEQFIWFMTHDRGADV